MVISRTRKPATPEFARDAVRRRLLLRLGSHCDTKSASSSMERVAVAAFILCSIDKDAQRSSALQGNEIAEGHM